MSGPERETRRGEPTATAAAGETARERRTTAGALGRLLLFSALFGVGLIGVYAALAALGAPELAAGSIAMAASAVAAGAVLMRYVERRPVGALGLAWTGATWRELGIGLAIGLVAITFATAVLLIAGRVRYGAQPGAASDWLLAVTATFGALAVPAFAEEVLFRGYPFQLVAQRAGAPMAVVVGSVAFAWAHGGNPNVGGLALANIFLAGVLLSLAYLRTRSLWFATALHLGWNWGMASLFDLPVSGLEFFDTPVYEPAVGGPDWLTGGAFGPEGGLIGTAAFGLAVFAVLRWPRLAPAPELRAMRPLADG